MDKRSETEVQSAYLEFSQAIAELRQKQQDLFKQSIRDLEQIAMTKVRKNLGIQ